VALRAIAQTCPSQTASSAAISNHPPGEQSCDVSGHRDQPAPRSRFCSSTVESCCAWVRVSQPLSRHQPAPPGGGVEIVDKTSVVGAISDSNRGRTGSLSALNSGANWPAACAPRADTVAHRRIWR
jgi:hypothetical protein